MAHGSLGGVPVGGVEGAAEAAADLEAALVPFCKPRQAWKGSSGQGNRSGRTGRGLHEREVPLGEAERGAGRLSELPVRRVRGREACLRSNNKLRGLTKEREEEQTRRESSVAWTRKSSSPTRITPFCCNALPLIQGE